MALIVVATVALMALSEQRRRRPSGWAQRAQEPPPDPEHDDPAPGICARNQDGTGFRAQERAHSRGQEDGFAPIAPEMGDENLAEDDASVKAAGASPSTPVDTAAGS